MGILSFVPREGKDTRWAPENLLEMGLLGGGFKYFYFHPYLGKIPILTNIFQLG